ncbi:DNA-binding protein [Methylobacterium sp. Leaf91]|uniref:DNA-binding protein n=1 Tax=Methylobacterium sp. Leaf91 TaxID=1736247 RepID=UPI0007002E44|nr:DNA-binding protein [Methylobacterium sp. Leaf91]KQO85969.1 hypothetical protein ASF32_09835 [Methylobacterium sp. Leaf91]
MPRLIGGADMVAKQDVWDAADRIRTREPAKGQPKERVSVRNVRKELGDKGSFGDIGASVKLWKAERGYRPIIEAAGLPEALEKRLTDFGVALMEEVRVEQTRARMGEISNGESEREAFRETLDEALAHADALEAKVAYLEAEIARLRASGPVTTIALPAAEAPRPEKLIEMFQGVYGKVRGRSLVSQMDAFWVQVREQVGNELSRRGPMRVHALHTALPPWLIKGATEIDMPLTPAWLRYHLLRMVETGDGLAEVDGCFTLADTRQAPPEPPPEPEVDDEPEEPRISSRRFWILFVAEVHDLLREVGPLTVEDILVRLPPGWVERTNDYKPIQPGRLRYKLRVRIEWKRPFEELPDGKFAATGPWPGSRSHDSEEAA